MRGPADTPVPSIAMPGQPYRKMDHHQPPGWGCVCSSILSLAARNATRTAPTNNPRISDSQRAGDQCNLARTDNPRRRARG